MQLTFRDLRTQLYATYRAGEFARTDRELANTLRVGIYEALAMIDREERPEPDPDAHRGVRRRANHYRA